MTWANPPNRSGTYYDWTKIARKIQAKPGLWLQVATDERIAIYNALRDESIVAMRGCEVRSANNHRDNKGLRRADIYVRWPERKRRTK